MHIATATATLPDGSEWSTHNPVSTPLDFSASFRVYDCLQAGVTFYTPYGSSIDWRDNWPGAVLNQRCDLRAFTVQPTLSWRITPRLSVGAGLMVTWGSVNLDKGCSRGCGCSTRCRRAAWRWLWALCLSRTRSHRWSCRRTPCRRGLAATGAGAAMGIPADYRFGTTTPASVNLNGTTKLAFGFNVGAMFDITRNLTVGASFRSKMKMTMDAGVASVRYANDLASALLQPTLGIINQSNFEASMPCPYVLAFGLGYKPAERWTLALDAQLTGWSAYKSLDVVFLDEKLTSFDQHLPKNYSNSWAFKAGAQFAATPRLDVMRGCCSRQ